MGVLLFELPLEEKQKYGGAGNQVEGYVSNMVGAKPHTERSRRISCLIKPISCFIIKDEKIVNLVVWEITKIT